MRSLRRRLAVTHTLVALLAVLLVAGLAGLLILRAYAQLELEQARVVAQRLSGQLAQYYAQRGSWQHIDLLLSRLADHPLFGAQQMVLADADGRVIFDSAGGPVGRRLLPIQRRQAVPVLVRARPVGFVFVPVGPEQRSEAGQVFLRNIALMGMVGVGAAGGAALLAALWLARRLTRPLQSLTAAANRLAAGKRHEPLVLPAEAELAELARAFNTMAAELARQQELRRSLVADIAHELRTPLSVLRLQVESLADGIAAPTPQTFASLDHEVGLLARLVDDLRLLSLVDAGQLSLAIEPLDARVAVERVAAAAEPRARQQGVAVRVEPGGPLPPVRADPQRLAQVLGNLLENALRYTPAGGVVTLRVRAENQEPNTRNPSGPPALGSRFLVLFEVSDTGPGIAAADLPHIFDRFFRTDRARARETGGSGLGLAIVQRLVEAQGGQVSVASQPGQGTTFRVALPAAEAVALPAPRPAVAARLP